MTGPDGAFRFHTIVPAISSRPSSESAPRISNSRRNKLSRRGRFDFVLNEAGIVGQRLWRETEIHEDIACFCTAPRFGVHRETELTDQRLAGRFVATKAPAKMLYIDIGKFPARRYSELVAVNHNPYSHAIKLGYRA